MGASRPFKCNLNERPFLECVNRKPSGRMRPRKALPRQWQQWGKRTLT
jgi:hypothetical protein